MKKTHSPIPISRATIHRRDAEAILENLMYDRLQYGDITNTLSKKLSEYFECSGGNLYRDLSTAIQSVYRLLQYLDIDTLVTSPFAVNEWYSIGKTNGFNVVLPQIDKQSFVIQSVPPIAKNDTAIKPRTATLLPNQYGYIEDIEQFQGSSAVLIEDVSDCVGAEYQSRRVGTFGSIVILSMESDNILTTGGGTAVLIREKSLLRKYRDANALIAQSSLLADYNAAFGLSQFVKLEQFVDIRKKIYLGFRRSIQKPHYNPDQLHATSHIPNYFPVVLSGNKKECIALFSAYNVEVQDAFLRTIASHNPSLDAVVQSDIKALMNQTILIPLNSSLSEDATQRIEQILGQLP